MKSATAFVLLTILLFLFVFTSCGRYIDKVSSKQSLPVKQGYFDFYPDSNILVYTSTIGLKRDTEKIYPKHFKITLPKGIKYYELTGSTDFTIYYDSKQVFFIRVDLEKNVTGDTMYIPKRDELGRFIQSSLTLKKSKYDIKEIGFNENRKNVFIRKGAATILLYNIKPSEYDLFYKSANTFNFVN
jgi:hypothetical protein